MLKKWLAFALKLLVSVALIWFLLGKVDLAAAKDRLWQVAPGMLALAAGLFVVQVGACAERWRAVLKAIDADFGFLKALEIFYIGAFFNQALPSSVGGDAVRIYKAYRAGLTMGGAFNGVMLERVATVLALVVLVAATLPALLPRIGAAGAWVVPAIALFAAASVAGLALLMSLDRLPQSTRRWRIVRGLAIVAADTRRVFLDPVALARVIGWALLAHLNVTLGAYVLALGLGLAVTWVDCMALIPPVLLVTTIPISIAGWGVREGAMVAAFGLIGVPGDGALVLSLLFGLLSVVVSLPGGVVWLMSADRRKVIEETESGFPRPG